VPPRRAAGLRQLQQRSAARHRLAAGRPAGLRVARHGWPGAAGEARPSNWLRGAARPRASAFVDLAVGGWGAGAASGSEPRPPGRQSRGPPLGCPRSMARTLLRAHARAGWACLTLNNPHARGRFHRWRARSPPATTTRRPGPPHPQRPCQGPALARAVALPQVPLKWFGPPASRPPEGAGGANPPEFQQGAARQFLRTKAALERPACQGAQRAGAAVAGRARCQAAPDRGPCASV